MMPNFTPGTELFAGWRSDLESGTPPTLYPVADAGSLLAQIEIGPGLVTLLGGPPGHGKTAFTMQIVVDALRLTPTLKALVANVEMGPPALLDRQLARLSGIDLHTIRHRKLTPAYADRLAAGMNTLAGLMPRISFVRPPYTLENVAKSGDACGADLLVLDYIQRFAPPGEHAHRKATVDAVMDYVRGMAECGVAMIVVAAVGRQRDEKGRSSYGGLNLASFRESSELEYGADDAFLLVRSNPDEPAAINLMHVKSRHGELHDIPLRFSGAVQRFDPDQDDGRLSAAVRDVWEREGGEGGDW